MLPANGRKRRRNVGPDNLDGPYRTLKFMCAEKFARYDSADYLKTEEDITAYLEAVMEEGGDDPAYIARALGTVARARNMTVLPERSV